VDDEPHVVTYLETLLPGHGFDTISAPHGKEGLKRAKTERPDLICLDITMPEESRIRSYRNRKENSDLHHIPVFVVTVVTGYAGDPESFHKFISTRKQVPPPEGFFSKPIDKTEFVAAVKKLLS
jgi:CheY-like chemotaxis protein